MKFSQFIVYVYGMSKIFAGPSEFSCTDFPATNTIKFGRKKPRKPSKILHFNLTSSDVSLACYKRSRCKVKSDVTFRFNVVICNKNKMASKILSFFCQNSRLQLVISFTTRKITLSSKAIAIL